MRKHIVPVIIAALLSVALYLLLFQFLLKKPLTLGFVKAAYNKKLSYSATVSKKRKIVVLGGSNVLLGIRCEEIEQQTGMKCVNVGNMTTSVDFMIEKSKEFIQPGDIVLLSLEYFWYEKTDKDLLNAKDGNNYIAQYENRYLARFGANKLIHILFSFELKDIISSTSEMILHAYGFIWNYNLSSLNMQGDRIGHTKIYAQKYADYIRTIRQEGPSDMLKYADNNTGSRKYIKDLLSWCRERRVEVFGVLPPTFDIEDLDQSAIQSIKNLYFEGGAKFMELDNNAQYERDCFFDGRYHLHEECQLFHSRKVGNYIIKHVL